ncbi:polysaccharide deacetylase family protein [Streptomyces sp. NRRL S-350]|uniref:polysaccharide deacetylase family protein n=1 Tax=Streptomyces sp. NRRL S-350 TaxID=1463902 RepID=UPI0004C17E46|nr:polysaccharide deacetylase family protein [Streptomyces sp. NRRL S-350]
MRGAQQRRSHVRTGLLAAVCLTAVVAGCAGPAGPAAPKAAPAKADSAPVAEAPAAPAVEAGAAPGAAEAVDRGAARPPAAPPLLPGLARKEEETSSEAVARKEATVRSALETAQRWGLEQPPLKAPPRPATRAQLTPVQGVKLADGRPPVVYRVPTDDKVVFLTVDDGAEKDPEFSRMAEELGIPLSAFVSDYLVRENYGYFRGMHAQGVEINNHTINHRNLKVLDYETQRQEICSQQDQLEQQIGVRPRLFRPPYGEYNDDTLRAAASCGVQAVPLWNEEAFPDHMEWRYDDRKLHPGDIILTHFRGTDIWKASMPDLLRKVVNDVTAAGFSLGRLDDYL